jgi:RNA polymerase sigma factor (sigma-70 family)
MPRAEPQSLLHHLRRLAGPGPADCGLLARLRAGRDDEAFAQLMRRHGPMVLAAARRVLGDAHAAEDVFQATFLLLARNAAAVRRPESLAGWLHGVAFRLAVRAKRRRVGGGRLTETATAPADPAADLGWREALGVLDEELRQLPDRLRRPLVLCYLQGRTRDEAARELAWSVGTLRRRLERGRRLLHARLSRRGVTLSAGLAGVLLAETSPVPAALQAATQTAAASVIGGGRTAGIWAGKAALVGACAVLAAVGAWVSAAAGPAQTPADPPGKAPPATAPAAADDATFRRAVAEFEKLDPKYPTMWQALAVLYARRGDAATARRLFEKSAAMSHPTSARERGYLLGTLGANQFEAGDRTSAAASWAEARRLAQTLPDTEVERVELLRFVAVTMAEAGDPAAALPLAKEVSEENARLNALRDVAAAQAAAGDVAGAQRTVELVVTPYGYFKLKPWKAIAAAQLKAGDRAGAQATLKLSLGATDQERDLDLSSWRDEKVEVLTEYALAQHRAGDADGARVTLRQAEKTVAEGGPRPSVSGLAGLARAFAAVGDRAAAERAVREFFKAVEPFEAGEMPLGAVVPAQVALGDLDGAVRTARQVPPGPSFSELCEVLAKAGRVEAALELAARPSQPLDRALAVLGVVRGIVGRTPADRPRRSDGAFAVTIPAAAGEAPKPEPEPPNPRIEFQSINFDYERSWQAANERLARAKTEAERQKVMETYPRGEAQAPKMLALARRHPGDPAALDALLWLVEFTRGAPQAETAFELLAKDHLDSKRLADACALAEFSRFPAAAERLLRTALDRSPHRHVRGQACLGLALLRKEQAARMRMLQRKPDADLVKSQEDHYGAEYVKRLGTGDPAATQREAEALFERVVAEFDNVLPRRSDRTLGDVARSALHELRALAVGQPAPDIDGTDTDGRPMKLSGFRGKVVVLVFWASWCSACRAEIPEEKALVKRLEGRPFVLLGVNGDADRDKLQAFLAKEPLPWRSWRDAADDRGDGHGPIATAWNVSAWPTVYVIDPRGVIRHRDPHGRELGDAVDALLREAGAGR